MKLDPRGILDAVLAEEGLNWSEADRRLVATCAADAVLVLGSAVTTDVEDELVQIRAQTLAISAAAAHSVGNVFRATVRRLIEGALGFVFARVLGA